MTDKKNSDIPQRKDIEEKYKWDLTHIYKSEDDWEADYKKAEELIEKAGQFAGKLSESADTLYKCLTTRSDLWIIIDKLHFYARRNADLDHRVSRYQEMTERAVMLVSKAQAAFSFVEPELLQIDNERLRKMASEFEKTDLYDFYIEDLIRSREHIRSAEIEELLAQSVMMARGAANVFTMLNDADMTYPSIKDEKGNEIKLTKQRFSKFMESSDQRVRRDAHEGMYTTYEEHINTLSASLASAVNKDVFYSRARKYSSSLENALDANNIPTSVYHSLLDTTEADLSGMHKWMDVRKRILKLDKIYPYDVYCPLFPDQNYEVKYEDAIEEVLTAVKPLGENYVSNMKSAFEKRWVDVYETEGKASGAYNASNYATHPLVLMNYNDTVNNMFTLAHEMGHCMHSYFSNTTQPYQKAQYTIFVAEVASTLNEGLLLQYLLKKSDDPKKKLYLLNRHIDNTLGTFFHQILYARFELKIHELVEQGGALSPDILNKLWDDLTRQYYGPSVTMDDYSKYKWSRIPHFYYTYYVYQYATSYAASQAILDKFNSGEEGIVDRYLTLLSSGGNDYPINQLKNCGVDMTQPGPVQATLKLFSEQVNEVEKLAGV
jgi:oligoendopeptidase F